MQYGLETLTSCNFNYDLAAALSPVIWFSDLNALVKVSYSICILNFIHYVLKSDKEQCKISQNLVAN